MPRHKRLTVEQKSLLAMSKSFIKEVEGDAITSPQLAINLM
jgi:hypothetical protein